MEINQKKQSEREFIPPSKSRLDAGFPHMKNVADGQKVGAVFDDGSKAHRRDMSDRNATEEKGDSVSADSVLIEALARALDASIAASNFEAVIHLSKVLAEIKNKSLDTAVKTSRDDLEKAKLSLESEKVRAEAKRIKAESNKEKAKTLLESERIKAESEKARPELSKRETEELEKREEIKLRIKKRKNELKASRVEAQKLRDDENERKREDRMMKASSNAIMAGAAAGTATGLALGAVGGPIGAGLGAGIGALAGLAVGATRAMFSGN